MAPEQVYASESVDAFAYALQAQLILFVPWRRRDPALRSIVPSFI